MYGLVIEGVRFMILENFGAQMMAQVQLKTMLSEKAISTHDQYSEHLVPQILKTLNEITGMSLEQLGVLAGRFFVQFLLRNGYGDLMKVMGRRFSDFLKGLDNIHEYFRFSYPKIKPPSFYCQSESEDGLVLHYRSRRRGYLPYVIGQLVELARVFYHQELGVEVLRRKEKARFHFVVIKLRFNNIGLGLDIRLKERVKNLNEFLPVDTASFLKMFPFFIAFNKHMEILMAGQGLLNLMPNINGLTMTDVFDLQKPCIKFTAEGCLAHQNCIFQLESLHPVVRQPAGNGITVKINGVTERTVEIVSSNKEAPKAADDDESTPQSYVTLRGPIIHQKMGDTFILLATCVVDTLDTMFNMGVYLNDYGASDCNREIIMASVQKSDTLKTMLDEEKRRSQVLTEMTKEIAGAKKKARQLLSQMMPYEVAKSMLKTGTVAHCEAFECVSVAFLRIHEFQKITLSLEAVDVVNLLNTLYSQLDEVVDLHGVYKVETIGECYMLSAGCPYKNDKDTEMLADCCLDAIQAVKEGKYNVSGSVSRLQVKIGVFSGPVVGGVVGVRTPRYCLFGDAVNCASRMESHNKVPMTIQIGQRTKDRLEKQTNAAFLIKLRGTTHLKGKGEMKVYELHGKRGRPRYKKYPPPRHQSAEDAQSHDGNEFGYDDDLSDHHGSSLSRMSIAESIEASNSRSNSTSEPENHGELNKTLKKAIQLTSKAVTALDATMDDFSTIRLTPPSSEARPKKTADGQLANASGDVQPSSRRTNANHISPETAPLDSRTSASANASEYLHETEETPQPTLGEKEQIQKSHESEYHESHASSASLNSDVDSTVVGVCVGASEASPIDKVPVEMSSLPEQHYANVGPHSSDSSDFDDYENATTVSMDKMHNASHRVGRVLRKKRESYPKDERKKTKRSLSKDKESEHGRSINKKTGSVKSKGSMSTVSGAHQKTCRCDEIKADSKIKTKVCTIM